MSFRLIVVPQAQEDLRRNAEWWSRNHSVGEATRWLAEIQSQRESIADFPQSHALSAENDDFSYEIRDKLLGLGSRPSYRAVFTIKGNTVFVLTVRRFAQDSLTPIEIESPPAG